MADLGGIAGILNAVVQRSVELQQNDARNNANENRTTTETAGTTQSAGAGTTSAATSVGEGLAFRPIDSSGTDQNTNADFTGTSGRVIVDQVTISDEARAAFEEAQSTGITTGGSTIGVTTTVDTTTVDTTTGETTIGSTTTGSATTGGATARSPAEAFIEDATNPAANLAFRADAAREAATIDGPDGVESAAESGQTNQVETNERDTGVVVGNTDVTSFSQQTRELGQLVDQFA